MAITIRKYIDIVSAVAGAPAATNRELIQRLFTTNSLVPVNGFIEMNTLDEVRTYFGVTSEEYLRSVAYFNFISKSVTQADKISFAGYSTAAAAALIIGAQQAQVLTTLQSFTTATLTIAVGSVSGTTAAIDLSGAADIAAAMTLIQSAIQAIGGGAELASATVAYDAVLQRVNFTAGDTGLSAITFSSATAGFLDALGWASGSATSDGTDGDSITNVLAASDSASDNFGSIVFNETLTLEQVTEAATWNHGQNVKYMYCIPVTAANSQLWSETLAALSGTALTTITTAANDYGESQPAIYLAATKYQNTNSVINYMFQDSLYPVAVNDTATSDTFDALRVNYNGETQQAGRALTFYQRGLLLGPDTAPLDMNTFANEMWFKDDILVQIANLLIALERVSANPTGVLQITSAIRGSITRALNNGTISVGKALNDLQRATIRAITNNAQAADQVSNAGYHLTVGIVTEGTETNAAYTLVYSKDDVIRRVTGRQILI